MDSVVGIEMIPVPIRSPNFLPPTLCTCPACFLSALAPPSCADACVRLVPTKVRADYEGEAAIAFEIIFTISKNKKYVVFTINILSIDAL